MVIDVTSICCYVQLCFYYLHALVLISLTGYSLTSHSVQLFPNWFPLFVPCI